MPPGDEVEIDCESSSCRNGTNQPGAVGPKFVDEQPQPGMEGRSTQKKHEKQLRILHFVQDDSAKSAFGVIFRADPSTSFTASTRQTTLRMTAVTTVRSSETGH
jgi:hypothetical protein